MANNQRYNHLIIKMYDEFVIHIKTRKHMNEKRLLYLLILTIFLGGCSQKITFKKSRMVPAAELNVKIDQAPTHNYNIELNVENLALPQDLTPAKNTYVVWIVSSKGSFNVGQLVTDKNLKGTLSTITPYKPTSIIITAEEDPEVTYPGMQVALTSEKIILD